MRVQCVIYQLNKTRVRFEALFCLQCGDYDVSQVARVSWPLRETQRTPLSVHEQDTQLGATEFSELSDPNEAG